MNRLQFGPLAMLDQSNGKSTVDKLNDTEKPSSLASTSQSKPSQSKPFLTEALSPTLESESSETHVDQDDRLEYPISGRRDTENGQAESRSSERKQAGAQDTRNFLDSLNTQSALVHSNLFIPMHYEKNYAYPLIVFLHDHHQNESQIQRVMPDIDCRNYAAISIRSWGKLNSAEAWPQEEFAIEHAHASLTNAIAKASGRLNINPGKIFLVGCGAGATMALRLAFEFPGELAGVAALNGALPEAGTPLSRLTFAREIPIYWAHFRNSDVFPEDQLCQGVSLLHTAGFNMTMRQYPVDETGCRQVYSDLNHWLMENVTA